MAGVVSGQTAFDKLVRRATVCSCEEAEISQCDEVEATELHGVEEREDRMSDGRNGVEGEGALAPPDWCVRAGLTHPSPRHQTKERAVEGRSDCAMPALANAFQLWWSF